MSRARSHDGSSDRRQGLAVPALLLGCGGALIAAGAVLIWQRGATVSFNDALLTAIAWCFG